MTSNVNTILCEDTLSLSRAATEWCRVKVAKYRARSLFVPAGKTPIALYKHWSETRPEFLTGLSLMQVDDVMFGEKRDVFKRFFEEHLASYRSQLRFIEHGDETADLAILGLGLNGHVAFHEPGLSDDFFSGCVRLDDLTCDTLDIPRASWGVTYGAGAFRRAKAILLTVNGSSKRDVLSRLLAGDRRLPATSLLSHPDVTLIADRDALPVGAGRFHLSQGRETHGTP